MKRSLFIKSIKQTFLAVPAAALMLGAANAGTTIGLNFQTWYYDSGNTPQTIGFNNGYSDYATTGMPVTAKAFGVDVANWYNTDPLPAASMANQPVTFGGTSTTFAGSLSCNVTAPKGGNSSGAGCIPPLSLQSAYDPKGPGYPAYAPGVWCPPGNDEVYWGEIFGNSNNLFSVSVTGLAAKFPNGYVIQSMSGFGQNSGFVTSLPSVDFTDGSTIDTANYQIGYITNSPGVQWAITTVGVSTPSTVFTANTLSVNSRSDATNTATLAGFIITDEPVITQAPANGTNFTGVPLVLNTGAIGIPPLSYQWELNGSPIPGATSASYTNNSPTPADVGSYTVVVTNLYGSTTSVAGSLVEAPPMIVTDLSTITNTVYAGFSRRLGVSAIGSLPVSYQWKVNGAAITGATSAALTASNLTAGLFGYSVSLTNNYGNAGSQTNYMNVMAVPVGLVNAYTPQAGADAPLAYWPLNETSGTIAYDYAGSGNNAMNNGSMTLGAAGPQPPAFIGFNSGNTAYQFDGATTFIACGTNVSFNGGVDFTVEAWIKTAATTTSVIIGQRDTNAFNGEYYLGVNASGTLYVTLYAGGVSLLNGFSSTKTVNDGNWHHVAFVRGGNTDTIYADGVAVASTNVAEGSFAQNIATYIGVDHRDNDDYFNGEMASVAIYSQALSANRILAHAVAGGIIPSVAIVNGSIGGLVVDSKPVGTPHNGVSHGTIWLSSSSDLGGITRSGVNEFAWTNSSQIVIPANADFNTTNGTISFWMFYNKPTTYPGPGSGFPILVDRRAGTGNGGDGVVVSLNSNGSIVIQPHGAASLTGSSFVVDGGWHHIAITYGQTTNDSVTLYVDGGVDTSLANSVNWTWNPTQEIELGKSHDSYFNLYDGQMDDFRIYNKILSQSEVQSIYNGDDSSVTDPSNLEVRLNFNAVDAPIAGKLLVFPYGTLQSSPVLGPGAIWTTVTNAASPQVLLPDPTVPAIFYRTVIAQ